MANLSVEQVEALSPTELVNYLNLNKDGLFLRDDHIKTLESLELAGSNFLKLTTQKLTNHPYNFPEGPVERIQDFISRLNSQSKFYHKIVIVCTPRVLFNRRLSLQYFRYLFTPIFFVF
ncbi:unnamed protein product [Rhizophagus irregularis]|nr:unnamed protein product [Rhizophagus irregularis]